MDTNEPSDAGDDKHPVLLDFFDRSIGEVVEHLPGHFVIDPTHLG